jgi:ketosteroid isomerase-like protein
VSQKNVEIVRRAAEAFNRRDLDAMVRDAADEVEVDWTRSEGVEAGTYRGKDAARAFWGTFHEVFDRAIDYPEDFIDCGQHVLMPNVMHFWGRGGVEGEAQSVVLVTFRDGRIVRWTLFNDRDEALKAVVPEE